MKPLTQPLNENRWARDGVNDPETDGLMEQRDLRVLGVRKIRRIIKDIAQDSRYRYRPIEEARVFIKTFSTILLNTYAYCK